MLKKTNFLGIPTFGKNAVVCGRSKNVGMPIAMLLHADNAGIYDIVLMLFFAFKHIWYRK